MFGCEGKVNYISNKEIYQKRDFNSNPEILIKDNSDNQYLGEMDDIINRQNYFIS